MNNRDVFISDSIILASIFCTTRGLDLLVVCGLLCILACSENKQFELKAFVEKGRISLFWPIFIFCRIELIFGRLTCFDMKSIVP